jgi:hypothetical protein
MDTKCALCPVCPHFVVNTDVRFVPYKKNPSLFRVFPKLPYQSAALCTHPYSAFFSRTVTVPFLSLYLEYFGLIFTMNSLMVLSNLIYMGTLFGISAFRNALPMSVTAPCLPS